MQRTTRKHLEAKAQYLNRLTGSPQERGMGHFYIYGAYGGYALRRIVHGDGASEDVLGLGFKTPSALYEI